MVNDIFQSVRDGLNEELLAMVNIDNINIVNEYNQNLLHEAVACGNFILINRFIELGIDVNHQDNNGQTPLHYAAQRRMEDVGETILMNKGDVLVADKYGNQPLWTAVFNARGDYGMVCLLLKYHAVPDHKNHYGKSPLDFSRQIKDAKIISILEG
ncbi:ankyrin repeat domain-containing protein [Pectobacterium parmentieri]|uniref:Ankyrin repeat domain-containing protein n=1 Tax=Pectobacterium parmentieri TaxID=1905730 RepID=A0A8B3F9G3_PECPM|nr:ankyrin repeat domain-containing protein [Pectobacterium parmentieri]AOR59892.1 hypothetical protein A8F97_13460 [Pectobacterium parmentieri]AYH04842.1 ankyrin repeat domain-containing protein [Pectobacterium parmentieri]AYH09119.1 ankyrin repeat domain-containing protein [Pectobacterium parmentieri]AYH20115.1 ankyrin repeat domain-containing protein [Pectobacterium parmentieri]AYH22365.1 ankyrin repeat domain-containing protein [Pectobacterium parmentieri]